MCRRDYSFHPVVTGQDMTDNLDCQLILAQQVDVKNRKLKKKKEIQRRRKKTIVYESYSLAGQSRVKEATSTKLHSHNSKQQVGWTHAAERYTWGVIQSKKGKKERKKERKNQEEEETKENSRLSLRRIEQQYTRKQQSKKGLSLFFFFHFSFVRQEKVETGKERERETMSGLDTNPSGMKEKNQRQLLVHIESVVIVSYYYYYYFKELDKKKERD